MELLLVLAFVAILASLALAVVTNSVQHARESTLKENLYVMRKAIDDYYADKGKYPASLEVLVENRYIRKLPVDPMTGRVDSWVIIQSEAERGEPGIIDVRSGSEDKSDDGVAYRDW